MYHETRSVYSDIHLPEKNNITTPRPITDSKLKRALSKDEDLVKFNVTPQVLISNQFSMCVCVLACMHARVCVCVCVVDGVVRVGWVK